MYRNIPEFNKTCIRASRERAYQKHMDALKRIQSNIPNHGPIPSKPQKSANGKRKMKDSQIDAPYYESTMMTSRTEGSSSHIRPYTLHGKVQKEEVKRIRYENSRILRAVQSTQAEFSRNTWMLQKIDSDYQVAKNSEFLRTVPMNEMIQKELSHSYKPTRSSTIYSGVRSSLTSRPRTTRIGRNYTQRTNSSMKDDNNQPFYLTEVNDDISDT